jgi:hypothetical protein
MGMTAEISFQDSLVSLHMTKRRNEADEVEKG